MARQDTFLRGQNRMEVVLLKVQSETFDILIGMDLLKEFHLTIYRDQFIISN